MKKIFWLVAISASLVSAYYSIIYYLQHEKNAALGMIVLSMVWGIVSIIVSLGDD